MKNSNPRSFPDGFTDRRMPPATRRCRIAEDRVRGDDPRRTSPLGGICPDRCRSVDYGRHWGTLAVNRGTLAGGGGMNAEDKCYEVSWDEAERCRPDGLAPGRGVRHRGGSRCRRRDQGTRAGARCSPWSTFARSPRSTGPPGSSSWTATPTTAPSRSSPRSASTRMLANFFMGLKRGAIPVKMFTSRGRRSRLAASAGMTEAASDGHRQRHRAAHQPRRWRP